VKHCNHCGVENPKDAARCTGCGADLAGQAPWKKVATLDSEVEADLLEKYLEERDVPHVLISHRDSAFDGIFQAGRGWGHVEAPPESERTILEMLNDLRANRSEETAGE
jgi:hypothetical protein